MRIYGLLPNHLGWVLLLLACVCTSVEGLRPKTDVQAAQYRVIQLPGAPLTNSFDQYAGRLPIGPTSNASLFFWLMESSHANSDHVAFWLNGGPGCSSMDGVFIEGGPYRLNNSSSLVYNNYTWNRFAHMVFVDQPAGTGLSRISSPNDHVQTQDQLSEQFYYFLLEFFKVFPSLLSKKIYLMGESYAGVYIPYIASKIMKKNAELIENSTDKIEIRLSGLMIGNGWIDPLPQYRAYIDYAYDRRLIDGTLKQKMEQQYRLCESIYNMSGAVISNRQCEALPDLLLDDYKKSRNTCLNVYRIDLDSDNCGLDWPLPDTTYMSIYLNRKDVHRALNLDSDHTFLQCDALVTDVLKTTEAPSVTLLPDLLRNMEVMLYYGDLDFICNYFGADYMLKKLKWNGYVGFQNETARIWCLDDHRAGTIQTARGLTYAVLHNASHMTPYDAPSASLDLFKRMLKIPSDGWESNILTETCTHEGKVDAVDKSTHVHILG